MLTARPNDPGSHPPSSEAHEENELYARFERRLDLWLSTYRLALGVAGLVLVIVLLPRVPWLWALGAAYVVAGAAVFPALRLVGTSPSGKLKVRAAILLVDVITVSMLTFRWGARASPAAFMYVPIVVGWALLPQRALGRLALVLVLSTLGVLLWLEPPQLRAVAPWSETSVAGRILFFGLIASTLIAVHELLSYTVAQLHEHSKLVSSLLAERRTRAREAELASQLEEAQRLEALGRLAGGIAHDFNNLLTVLLGSAEIADAALQKDPAAARREIQCIKSAAERGSGLTAQLLEFASRRPTEPRDIDLSAAVAATAELLQRLLPANVKLLLELSQEPCGVRLDPSSLERILLNLSVNAVDAMPDGGTLSIAVGPRLDASAERVRLEVRDTGTGIAAEDMPFIFEPFFTRKPRGKGTGLGLASVYGIVRQTHGEIDAESVLGRGTTFGIHWPRVPLGPELRDVVPRVAHRAEGTILVVDDDQAVRGVVTEHLRSAGYHVISAASGMDAISLIDRGVHVDLLLSDVSMPGMSGVELAEAVRARGSRLPILLISGYADELGRDKTRAQLEARFLAKPFTRDRLIAEVGALLEPHEPPRERSLGARRYRSHRRRI